MQTLDVEDKPFAELAKGSGLDRTRDRVHLSDIIKYIRHTLKLDVGQASFQDLQLAGEIGFIWEGILELVFKERVGVRPPELECDGIAYSPDGVGYLGDPYNTTVLEEYKAAWHSCNKKPTDIWKWMTQCKSYCHALGLTIVEMHILYVVGNYRGSGPIYRRAVIEYTQEELDSNWAMILRAKEEAWAWTQEQHR